MNRHGICGTASVMMGMLLLLLLLASGSASSLNGRDPDASCLTPGEDGHTAAGDPGGDTNTAGAETVPDAIAPAHTRGEIEPPAGEKDMGRSIAAVYTAEQQLR